MPHIRIIRALVLLAGALLAGCNGLTTVATGGLPTYVSVESVSSINADAAGVTGDVASANILHGLGFPTATLAVSVDTEWEDPTLKSKAEGDVTVTFTGPQLSNTCTTDELFRDDTKISITFERDTCENGNPITVVKLDGISTNF